MSTLEELRKKRLQEKEISNSGSRLDVARKNRIEEIKTNKYNFTEAPKPIVPTVEEEGGATGAAARTVAVNTLPTLGGVAAGAATGAVAGSVFGPVGTVAGFIGGGITGAIITKKAQDKALEVTQGEEWKRNFDQQLAEDRQNHPMVTLFAETAPQLITFKPSPTTLKQAFSFSKRILTDTKSLSSHIKTLEGKTELNALINVGVGAGVNASLETYQQAREGDINALRILGSAVLGGAISDPNRLGVKLGFSPSGDAVIEEYNKYGSQTDAAKIITENNIPMIDRSADGLFKDRQELTAILKGQGEANRFTEPRILQAEKISGTIEKDVTPDSNLRVYRLDGREGPMRIGERVTANPHIADVFGGRINPEATVLAGDLVRTSRGDYVYVPKSEISEQPKLPPVTAAVEKEVRAEVKTKERNLVKETKAKEVEAKRLAEEPARLQREAEALAEKERVQAEKNYNDEIKRAEITKAKLAEQAEQVRKESLKKIIQEKKRIETEKTTLTKSLDKEIDGITAKLRKDINATILDHNKRLAKATTKTQKTKEQIRFNNKKAALTAKAIKDKKALRTKTASAIKNIKNNVQTIKKEALASAKDIQKQIKSIPKPVLQKVETVVRPDFAKPKEKSTVKEAKASGQSFDEWVKGQGETVYRGEETVRDPRRLKEGETQGYEGVAYTRDQAIAKNYGDQITEGFIPKNKILTAKDIEPSLLKIMRDDLNKVDIYDADSMPTERLIARAVWLAKQAGKDGADIASIFPKLKYESEIRLVDKSKIKTRTQLKAEWDAMQTNTPEVKPKTEPISERTTTIGTKVVKSQSIIKNAVKDAEQNTKVARDLDVDVTEQMGTTFVEQRKLSAELIAEKGIDEALVFARGATDAEISKLNINRSALYETLYKTIIGEGQFAKYRDELEDLALLVSDEVSAAAQKSSLHRLATQNDPFRRIAKLKKSILEKEKETRGTVFEKEVEELYAKIKKAGTDEDLNQIINDNLC